ncbi:MAG TPA: hypothetical protein VLM40_16620, partial [Gemmata sp.]|nr:hypothetical protein [Gemmata sp.]
MPLHVKCPACGAKLKAPEDRLGKKARCNKCNTSFRIPKDLPRDAATDAAKSRPGGTALPPLSDLDDAIPMATAADDLETPPLADATPTPPGRPFDSGESPPKKVEETAIPRAPADRGSSPPARRNATPPSGETPARGKSKPVLPPTPANPPPPNAEPEILSLEDDGPPQETHTASGTSIPTVSDSLAFTGDPFAFGQARPATKEGSRSSRRGDEDDQLQKKGPAGDRSSPRETLPEDDDEPPRPRYVRPGEKNSGKQTLLLAAVLGLLSIGALAAAIVVMTNRKREEPPTAKKEQKPEEPAPPAPAEKGGAAAPPVQQPAPAAPPKPNPQEPAKKDSPEPPKKDSKQPPPSVPRTAVFLELPPKLPGFQLGKLPDKPELAQRPTGSSIAIEVPFEKIERVFAPQNRTTQDVIAVWVSNPGFNGKGQQLSVDSYSSTTGRR